jgi:hypothetical protein
MNNERSVPELSAPPPSPQKPVTPWRVLVLIAVVEAAVVGLLLTAFAWPSLNIEPRDVPLAVASPAASAASVEAALAEAQPGAFDVRAVPDAAAARQLILDREVYGAVIVGPQGPQEVLVASAASPLVAQTLTQAAESFAGPPGAGTGPVVTDVAPAPEGDPRGLGLAAGALPLTLAGVITGAAMALRVRGPGRQLAGSAFTAAFVGPVVVGVLHGWLGALAGNPVAEMGVVALGVLAGALLVLGSHALLGVAGLSLGAAVMVLVGNPLSAATSAPELLPAGWAELGQALPPGALVNALRGVSGFDGAGVTTALLVLSAWVVAGAVAVLAAALLRRTRATTSGRDTAPRAPATEAVPS